MNQLLKKYNLFYIFVCLVWQPLHLYIRTDAAGRTILLLSILAILFNLAEFWKERKLFTKRAFVCWFILLGYSLWNVFAKGFSSDFSTIKFLRVNFLDTFVLLIVTMLELRRDKGKTLRLTWSALGVYLIMGLPFVGVSDVGKFFAEGLGNLYSLHAVCFLFVSMVLFAEGRFKWSLFLTLAAITTLAVILTGSRKAFGATVIILVGAILNNGKRKNLFTWIRIVVYVLLLLYGVVYVMNHTLVGSRIYASSEEIMYVQLVKDEKTNDFLILFLGDRAIQYQLGLELFWENYWTGIGLTNFTDVSGYDCRIHSEYIVQLCENGIIGFALLLLYYILLIRGLRRSRKGENKNQIGVVMTGLIALMFLNFTTWTYCQNYAMVFYAIFLMYAYFDTKTARNIINSNENSNTPPQGQLQ